MREVGLYGLLFGVKKTAKKFGYEERDVLKWAVEAFDDPFFEVFREVIKASIVQVGEPEASRIFGISEESVKRFVNERGLNVRGTDLGLRIEEWFLENEVFI